MERLGPRWHPPWSVVYLRASRRHLGLEGSDVAIVFTHSTADLVDVGFLDARQAHGRSSSKLKKVNTLALILVLHAKGTLQIRDQIWFWYFLNTDFCSETSQFRNSHSDSGSDTKKGLEHNSKPCSETCLFRTQLNSNSKMRSKLYLRPNLVFHFPFQRI